MGQTIDPIVIPVEGKLVDGSIEKIESQFGELNERVSNMDFFQGLPDAVQPFFDSFIGMINESGKALEKTITSAINGKQIGEQLSKSVFESLGYYAANTQTINQLGSSFSKIFSSIPAQLKNSFNVELNDMIRSATDILHGYTSTGNREAVSDASLTRYLMKNSGFSKGVDRVAAEYGLTDAFKKELAASVAKMSVPVFSRSDYINEARKYASGHLQKVGTVPQYTTYKDRLPEQFRNLPQTPKLKSRQQVRADESLQGELSPSDYTIVKRLAASNPTWEKALTMAGVATRTTSSELSRNGYQKAGTLVMPGKPITKAQYAMALGYLDKDLFRPGLEGAPMYRHSLSDSDAYGQRALANKTSRIPTESIQAFEALKGIGIDPVYVRAPRQLKYQFSPDKSVALKSELSVRPDAYQIQSLTWDDFKNGVKLDKTAPKQNFSDDRAAGQSVNKMISRSVLTDLLGMHGHNTYGNGSVTDNDRPIVMQLDLSKDLMLTENGRIKYGDDRKPIQNPATKELIKNIFAPKATLKSSSGEDYRYPVVSYGDRGNYVPVNAKNGLIWLAEEGAYRKASQSFIDKHGVNAFDNLIEQDQEFSTYEALNKGIEARNRSLTPSVPFSELGGRMPDKRKIGFPDLEYVTGLNGGSLFMPGYIPGEAGTIRSLGIKGSAMSADYKKAYRMIYGDDAKWYMPFINAPKAIKDLYAEKGIDAVKQAYQSPNLRAQYGLGNSPSNFDKHFFDALTMDALIPESLIKTPFYNGMSMEEMQDAMTDIASMTGGFRMVATAREFSTNSSSLSKQVAQNLDLTPDDLEANRKQWDQYIFDLRNNPEKAVQYLFSDQSIPLNKQLNENPGLLWQIPEAKGRVLEAIESAEADRQYNRIFAKDDIHNALALPNIGEIILKTGALNGLTPQDEQLAKVLGLDFDKKDADTVALSQWAGVTDFSSLRFPNNVTEQYGMRNSEEYIKLLDQFGMNKDAMYLNMKTIAKMGGGDVDGDTVTSAKQRLNDIMRRTHANRTNAIGDYTQQVTKVGDNNFEQRQLTSDDFADLLYRQAYSTLMLSAVSNASDALSQGNWSDPNWVRLAGRAGYDLKAMYDIDSTFMKSGMSATWSAYANNAKNMGKPFASIFRDLIGAVNEGDYSKMADFSKVNFPSVYSGLTVSALDSIAHNPLSIQAINKMIAAQSDMQNIPQLEKSNRPADRAKAEFLRHNNMLFSQYLSKGAFPSSEDSAMWDELLSTWNAEVYNGLKASGLSEAEKQYYKDQEKEVKFQLGRQKHKTAFGLTQDAIEEGKGYAGAGVLRAPRYTGQGSFFDQEYSAENDRKQLEIALATGANDTVLSGMYGAAERTIEGARIAEAKARADRLRYSWSMMHQLESGDPKNFDRWYKNRINGDYSEKIESNEIDFGSAMSQLLQDFAKHAVDNNQDRGTAEQWEARLNEILTTDFAERLGGLPSAKTNSTKYSQNMLDRYSRGIAFARALPEMFADEDILGAEVVVSPRMGYQFGDQSKPLISEGKIDLQTRNKAGEIINTEMKPYLDYQNLWDQVLLYNPGRNAKYARALSYADTADYGDRSKFMKTREYREEEMQAVEQRMRRLHDVGIGRFAETGFDPLQMAATFMPFTVNGDGTYRYLQPGASLVKNVRDTSMAMRNVPEQEKKNVRYESEKPDSDEVDEKEARKNRIELGKNTGTAIARAMSLQQEINDYEQQMREIGNKMFSRRYKAEHGDRQSNWWDSTERQLTTGYLGRRTELENKGASKEQLASLDNASAQAMDEFEKALRSSASADLLDLGKDLDKKIQEHGTSSSARGYASEFDNLSESIDRASQAYQKLKEDLGKKPQNQWTEEESKALKAAEEESVKVDEKANQYRSIIAADAKKTIQAEQDRLLQTATGQPLSTDQKIDRQVAQFDTFLMRHKADIALLQNKGIISEDEAKGYLNSIDGISKEQYREVLENNLRNATELQNLRMTNSESLAQARADAALRQQSYSSDAFLRQQRNRYSRSRIVQAIRPYEERAISLNQNISSWEDARNAAQRKKEEFDLQAKNATGDEKKRLESASKIQQIDIDKYNQQIADARSEIEQLNSPTMAAAAAFQTLGSAIGNVAARLGRQIFHKALQETKRFIQEFDASMNEVQAITLKSDKEMQAVRSQTINKALNLRTSVSNVSSTEAALYRQGLSDAEVSARTDSIIKFATVAKLKTEDATKILTTAIQNDLVGSVNEAMDALTALGDSAATTAAEIGKGMQKAAAAAKVAGVSYAELTALLTIGTSDTQLSGTQVGTALQTVFSRMRRLSLSGYTADQNGEKTTASDAEAALAAVGVNLWDDKAAGKMRTAYDVLLDLSKVWQNINDAQKNIVMNALAGTRQTNIFSTLMEGMSEDGGATLEKYLGLAENSNGITQTKYQIAMESLAASLNEVKTSWDAVVESFTSNGTITGALDVVSGFLQTIADLGSSGGGKIGVVFTAIAAGIAGLTAACLAAKTAIAPFASLLGLLAGGTIAAIGIGLTSLASSGISGKTASEQIAANKASGIAQNNSAAEARNDAASQKTNVAKEVRKLGEAYDELEKKGDKVGASIAGSSLIAGLEKLKNAFPEVSDSILAAIQDLSKWEEAVDSADKAGQRYLNNNREAQTNDTAARQLKDSQTEYNDYMTNQKSFINSEEAVIIQSELHDLTEGPTVEKEESSGEITRTGLIDLYNKMLNGISFDLAQPVYDRFKEYMSTNYSALWSQGVEGWDNDGHDSLIAEAMQGYIDYVNESAEMNDQRKSNLRRELSIAYARDMAKEFNLDSYATDDYSSEFLGNVLIDALDKEIMRPENGLIDASGNLITEAVTNYISGIIKSWTTESGMAESVAQNADLSSYAYRIDSLNKGFNNLEDAEKAAKEAGLSADKVTTGAGAAAFSSPDQAIDALLLSQKDKNAENLTEFLRAANRSKSISELISGYDWSRSGILSSVMSNNGELFNAFIMARNGQMSYDEFLKAANQMQPGRTNRAGLVQSVYDAIESGTMSVSELRTDFPDVYKTFSSIVGDAADALLNSIEDGVRDADLEKAFNRSVIEARMKEADQFKEGYAEASAYVSTAMFGTAAERRNQNIAHVGGLQTYHNYSAAVERYLNGTATAEDLATIANNDQALSTIQLQNGGVNDEVSAGLSMRQQELIDARNNAIGRFVTATGITAGSREELLNTKATAEQVQRYMRSRGITRETLGNNYDTVMASLMNMSQWGLQRLNYGENLEETYNDLYNNDAYVYDQNGNVIGIKPGSEEKLTVAGIKAMRNQSQAESNMRSVYDRLVESYNRRYPQVTTGNALAERLSSEDYEKLMQTDAATLLDANVSAEELYNYAIAQQRGSQRNVYEQYNKAWEDLFGGQDISAEGLEQARDVYRKASENTRKYYDSFLNGLTSEVQDYILNETPTVSAQSAVEAQEIQRLSFGKSSLGGAFAYAQRQYRQNNRAGFAANTIFEAISGQEASSATELLKVLGDSRIKDSWKDLLETSPDLAKKLNDLGLNIDSNGNWSASADLIASGAEGAAAALAALTSAAQQASEQYGDATKVQTSGETYKLAQDFWQGNVYDEEAQMAALRQLMPSSFADNAIYNYDRYMAATNAWNAYDSAVGQLPEGFTIDEQGNVYNPGGLQVNTIPIPAYSRPEEWRPTDGLNSLEAETAQTMMNNLAYGRSELSPIESYQNMLDLQQAINSGNLHTMFSSGMGDIYGQTIANKSVGDMDMSSYMEMIQRFETAGLDFNNAANLQGEELDTARAILAEYGKNITDVSDLQRQFNAEVGAEAVEAYKIGGDAANENAEAIRKRAKDQKSAMQQAAADAKKTQELQDQLFAASSIRGKSGKSVTGKGKNGKRQLEAIQNFLGLPDDASVKNYLKDKKSDYMDMLANNMEADANKQFSDRMIKPALKTLLDGVEQAVNDQNNPLTLDQFIEISTELQTTGDAGAFMDKLSEYIDSEYLEPLRTWEGLLAELTISGNIEKGAEDLHAWFEGFLEMASGKLKKPSGYSGGGGGGGGGGGEKSPAQKLLERQKHEATEAQHYVKMQEIYQTHYDFINDYDAYIDSLGKEEEAYNNLSAMYQRHIGELESMLGGLEAYSDDWWSVKEALDAAKESLADVQNKIDAIETKRVDIIVQKQENEDKPSTQKQSLWTEKARSYQIRGQFESYAVSEGKRIEEIDEQRKLNEDQIRELEKTLNETTEGGDAWLKARDQIWALQVENAQLANDQEEARRALQLATVQQAQTDLQNRLTPRTHEQSMLDSWGTLYQNNRQHDYYRNVLGQQNDMSNQNIGLYTQYIAKLREQMDTVEKGSEAWYTARDAIFEYEEAIAQATVSIDENNRAIEQSKIDELKKEYEDVNKDLNHQDNVLKTQQDRYDKNGNFTMYQEVIGARLSVATKNLTELKRQLDGYLAIQGEITEGTDQWDELTEAIRTTSEEYERQINDVEELQRLAAQSKFEHDKEEFDRQNNLDEHLLKMIQYEESMYQNRGELTNQNTMIGLENEQRRKMVASLQDYLVVLQEDLNMAEAGSEEYYEIADAIYKAEEEVKNHTNAIEKNTETMKKNEEQILKIHKALLDTIDNEYKARDRQRREMLSAEVSIQNQILNLIRNRYKKEWALIKEDIARKKSALQEEKSLINERLNARLNADKMQDKAEELAELKRQLALISSDPTRTKDALELSKKIETLEKELADQIAQDEAKAATNAINDEVKALDEYAQYNEKVMNEMLKDANSTQLAEELAAVMGDESMSREDRIANYMDWIRQNDDNYKYGTEAMRMQLEQSNTDSWNKMLGFVETYWDKVDEIVGGGLDSILSFMKESWSWRDTSEPGRSLLELGWTDAFEDYLAAYRNDAEYEHGHDLTTAIEDEIYDINDGVWELVGKQKELYDLYTALIEFDYIRPTDVDPDADKIDYRDYAGWGRKAVKVAGETLTFSSDVKKENGKVAQWITVITNAQGDEVMRKTFSSEKEAAEWRDSMLEDFSKNGNNFYSGKTARDSLYERITQLQAQMDKVEELSDEWLALREKLWDAWDEFDFNNTDAYLILKQIEEQKARDQEAARERAKSTAKSTYQRQRDTVVGLTDTYGEDWRERNLIVGPNAGGGLIDYTGLAWVDGSMSSPESFLDATDTELLRGLLDTFKYINTPASVMLSDKWFGATSTTIGDINITINQAELNSDMDIEETAREIGRAFARQLERNGLNLAGYTW